MTELFYSVRCDIIMPEEAEDYQTAIDIPGGMSQKETFSFWAEIEEQYGAVEIVIVEEKDKWLWWST